MLEEVNCGCLRESSFKKGVDRLAGKSSGSRSWAASGPLGLTGTAGAGVGTNGERVQWGPEHGTRFFAGASGKAGVEIGTLVSGVRNTTTCSPHPACAGEGASRTPASETRAVPNITNEQGKCKSARMIVRRSRQSASTPKIGLMKL